MGNHEVDKSNTMLIFLLLLLFISNSKLQMFCLADSS